MCAKICGDVQVSTSGPTDPLALYFRQLVEPFGWQSVKPKSESIVITGSEVDSLAITQNTEIPSIALKNLTFFPLEVGYYVPLLHIF